MIQIEKNLCKKCNICVELCPKKVFGADELGKPFVQDESACTHCLTCELHCPEYAIEIERVEKPKRDGKKRS